MMKRNDGYTLAYVVVVLGVMATVALATMTLALLPQKSLHNSMKRMQDKYAAQGKVEQVVAQLEHADTQEKINGIIGAYLYSGENSTKNPYCEITPDTTPTKYTVVASYGQTVVTAEFTLTERKKTETTGEGEDAVTTTTTVGYTVTYTSYKTEVIES